MVTVLKSIKEGHGQTTSRLAGLGLLATDKSFENLEGNQSYCERH